MTEVATISSQGQITIPVKIRELLGLEAGGKVVLETKDGEVKIARQQTRDERWAEIRAQINPALIEKNRDKTARELAEEFAGSPEGQAYWKKRAAR